MADFAALTLFAWVSRSLYSHSAGDFGTHVFSTQRYVLIAVSFWSFTAQILSVVIILSLSLIASSFPDSVFGLLISHKVISSFRFSLTASL